MSDDSYHTLGARKDRAEAAGRERQVIVELRRIADAIEYLAQSEGMVIKKEDVK